MNDPVLIQAFRNARDKNIKLLGEKIDLLEENKILKEEVKLLKDIVESVENLDMYSSTEAIQAMMEKKFIACINYEKWEIYREMNRASNLKDSNE